MPSTTTERFSSSITWITRAPAMSSSSPTSCDSSATWTVLPRLTRPESGSRRPARSARSVVLPAPLTPTTPYRSPGPRRHVTSSSSTRSPWPSWRGTATVTSSRSSTSLPRRFVAVRVSSSVSRGGGTSAMSAAAASSRNLGLDVRAGAPRRSHASSLRSRLSRFSAATAAVRWRSARASTYAAYPPS
ncbi:Uncharacterised protein [Mycobacteroides abscessus]|nr:Uncharacterised protein [Mycobacteroides abscessus]